MRLWSQHLRSKIKFLLNSFWSIKTISENLNHSTDIFEMILLFQMLAEKWLRWLPESTENTVKEGAFWAWEFIPGLKIISINSGYGQSADWYTTANNTDVHGMLQWMSKLKRCLKFLNFLFLKNFWIVFLHYIVKINHDRLRNTVTKFVYCESK